MTIPPQPQQQPSQGQQDTALALAAASALAGAATVAEAAAILGPVLVGTPITLAALKAALAVVMSHPPDREGFYGPATTHTARLNLMRRAQFLVAAARRMSADQKAARSAGKSWDVFAGISRERRYYGQHMMAMWGRMNAAAQVDSAAMTHGMLLGWHTVLDRRTSPECIAANRHNFWADDPPAIGYPGAVHPYCRCWPGAPFPGAPLVGGRSRVWRGQRGLSQTARPGYWYGRGPWQAAS
jgi:hypothetical protein